MLNTAVEDALLVANPCSIKGAGVEPAQERRIPDISEVYALADDIAPHLRAFVLLAAFGGLRRGELLALTRRDVDLLHRTVDVRLQRQEGRGGYLTGPPKTDAERRRLVLPAVLVPELEAHLARWALPVPTASCSRESMVARCGSPPGRRNGPRPASHADCSTSTSTIFAMLRGPWPLPPARAPRS